MKKITMTAMLLGLVVFGFGQDARKTQTSSNHIKSNASSYGKASSHEGVPSYGRASFYSKASFYGGYKITANGERFNPKSMTAAHKTLPFGSIVKIENINNGKTVMVKINNRGPYVKGRDLDLTAGAFEKIAPLKQGVVSIRYTVLSIGDNKYWREDKGKWFPVGNKIQKQKQEELCCTLKEN